MCKVIYYYFVNVIAAEGQFLTWPTGDYPGGMIP